VDQYYIWRFEAKCSSQKTVLATYVKWPSGKAAPIIKEKPSNLNRPEDQDVSTKKTKGYTQQTSSTRRVHTFRTFSGVGFLLWWMSSLF